MVILITDKWGAWSTWSECSSNCGAGQKTRQRNCLVGEPGGFHCTGSPNTSAACVDESGCST